jgi:hypothetical protein
MVGVGIFFYCRSVADRDIMIRKWPLVAGITILKFKVANLKTMDILRV